MKISIGQVIVLILLFFLLLGDLQKTKNKLLTLLKKAVYFFQK